MSSQIPFNKPSLIGHEVRYIRDAIARGQLSGDGYYTSLCNRKIEQITGTHKALITHSCTAALEMAAMLCGLEPGDEVIMPSYTFVSTANAVALRGAVPVFVDINEDTLNICPRKIEEAVTRKTKAVFVVHYAGFPADMDAIKEICHAFSLFLVEDAAQALGSTYKNKPAGSLGDFSAFSFHETKNVISGEGGAIAINSQEYVAKAEVIREKGTNRSRFFRGEVDKYCWEGIGSSFLPGELIASYLFAQLENSSNIRERRLSIYENYKDAFNSITKNEAIKLPKEPINTEGNGHMFYLLMPNLEARTAFIDFMKNNGIGTPFHYVPLHSAPAGKKYGKIGGALNVTDRVSETLVRLPMYYDLGSDIEKVISVALDFLGSKLFKDLA